MCDNNKANVRVKSQSQQLFDAPAVVWKVTPTPRHFIVPASDQYMTITPHFLTCTICSQGATLGYDVSVRGGCMTNCSF